MSDVAIRVEGLGKQYRLGGPREQYSTLRDQFRKWTSLRGMIRRADRAKHRPTFWALKDISFEVNRGEVVGIIGRNGAGKSTLLKILSRITEPSEGAADIHGRVGSLLEVGTGFHPELTGRENVFLNGAIMGMRRAEIERKFDEIVAFSEIEKFIDTSVKHYSSGMYMRLAFAVAAHLEQEILIVDEVLAVGDAQFQGKCLGKMGEVAEGGRTVLFVSHNMSAIQRLCDTIIMLDEGNIAQIGPSAETVGFYMNRYASGQSYRRKNEVAGISISSATIEVTEYAFEPVIVLTSLIESDRTTAVTVDLRLTDRNGTAIAFGSLGTLDPTTLVRLRPGLNRVVGRFRGIDLAIGGYSVGIDITYPDSNYIERIDNCLSFNINGPPRPPAVRRTLQHWGMGSCELKSTLLDGGPSQS